MKRFLTVVAATAAAAAVAAAISLPARRPRGGPSLRRSRPGVAPPAAAAAVAAATSLPAGADDPGQSTDAQFVTCLRAHGAGVPAGARGAAIKTWVIGHEDAAVG